MIDPTDRRAPISPQLAVRVASLGMIAFVLFAIVFFRLWFLQVLSGDQFLAEATQNRVRTQPIQAPRGFIVDRNGEPLVKNRKATVLQLDLREIGEDERALAAAWGAKVIARSQRPKGQRGAKIAIPPPPAELAARFKRFRKVTKLTVDEIQELVIVGIYQEPFVPVQLTEDVSEAARNYVIERKEQFRGLSIRTVYLRDYPNDTIGAQLYGTVGEIGPKQIGTKRYRGVRQGSIVGQAGLERTYDRYLRGRDGEERIFVNAAGQPIGSTRTRRGQAGRQLRTSIDLKLQKTAQTALQQIGGGKPGAFVAMDPYTGEVYAMGSAPTFDPNELSRPLSGARFAELYGDDSGAPLTNRAVSAQYSTGSTFKIVTALAGLSAGVTTPEKVINDTGRIELFPNETGDAKFRQNAGAESYGPVALRKAIQVSSDIYFYLLGKDVFSSRQSLAIQTWARRLGFGRLTKIDTGAETTGVIPGPKWRQGLNDAEATCRKGTKTPAGKPKAKGAACGIADGSNRPFLAGDNVNLSIGQGDLQATPLQVALSYAAIATGGTVPTPHIGVAIQNEQGEPVQQIEPEPARKVDLPADGLAAIRDGLHAAASAEGGTSTCTFSEWNQDRWPIFGKTGTAQVQATGLDQSWYAAYVPKSETNKEPLLVVATVEGGGFGAETAAPIARRIFSQWYTKKIGTEPVCTAVAPQ